MPGHDDQAPVELITLYRGLSVPAVVAESVVSAIRQNGFPDLSRSTFHIRVNNLRGNIDRLLLKDDLTTLDTRPDAGARDVICACGDRGGAVFYARRGRPEAVPILIAFTADISRVHIDARDALYNVFTQGSKQGDRTKVASIWGDAIMPYLDRAWAAASISEALACCDLAIEDYDVIRAHCGNSLVIGGRYQTRFSSSFLVEVPVVPTSILGVEVHPESEFQMPDITLAELLGRQAKGLSR